MACFDNQIQCLLQQLQSFASPQTGVPNEGFNRQPFQNQNDDPNVGQDHRGNLNDQANIPPLIGQGGASHLSQVQPRPQNPISQNGINPSPLIAIAPPNRTHHPEYLEERSSYHLPPQEINNTLGEKPPEGKSQLGDQGKIFRL